MKITLSHRLKIGVAPLALGIAALSQPAFAQEAADDAATQAEDTTAGEAIVVTGSRIASPNVVSLAPVQVVSAEDIRGTGAVNVQEVLLENPVFGTPGLSRTNSAFLTSGAGAATVDLRDLGSDRTLVLIDGRRVVAGLPGTATVDLNMIPTQFVESVDILTGGASSLYGSDAVAGVVNFKYKRNFEGLEAEAQYGLTERGDSARYQLSMTGGGNFADDRGNLMVHLGYTKERGLLSRHRKNTLTDDISYITYTYEPEDYYTSLAPFYSSFVPQGRFDVNGTAGSGDDFTFDPTTGQLLSCYRTNSVGPCGATGPQGFNRQYYRTLAVPVERYVFATRGTFEVTDSISAFVEGTYSKTESSREIEPFAGSSSDVYPVTGRVPIQTMVDGVAVLNPFVPAAIAAAASDIDGDGLLDIGYARRFAEVGSRYSSSTRDTFRIVAGLEGTILDGRFRWDASYNYGQTSETQKSTGQINTVNMRYAFAAISDTAEDLDNDGITTGDVICADATARAQGCQPLNLFGMGSISPEALAYINAEGSYSTRVSQQVWSANISGELFDLPGGPVAMAIGGEYRKESSTEDWDALTNGGLNAGNALPDTSGSFNVKEIYGELNVPILSDVPFFHQLSLRAAGRLSDYSTVGGVETYSVGGEWAPVQDIRFRATYAKSVRAPNVGELFTGPSQTFPSGISDPCVGVTATSTGAVSENCRRDAGVLANIAANNGTFTITQADRQGISGYNSGNENLDVERSRSITAGVVINPRSIEGLRNLVFSADYFNIRIKDAIVAPPRSFTLNQCYSENVDYFCDLITRRQVDSGSNSAGSLEYIDAPLINGGVLKTEGLDFVLQYRTKIDALGGMGFNTRISWTHLLDGYSIPIPGAPKDPFKGEIGTATDRVNASVGFSQEDWSLSFTGNYIGKSYEDNSYIDQINAARANNGMTGTITKHDIATPAQFYLDTQLKIFPTDNYEFYFGVDNLLDNKAPKLLSGTTYNVTGSDTAADVYDIFGRRYYAGVRLKF